MSIEEGDDVIDRIEEGDGDLEEAITLVFLIELPQLVPPSLSISELIDSESVSLKKRLTFPFAQVMLPFRGELLQDKSVGSSDGEGEVGG